MILRRNTKQATIFTCKLVIICLFLFFPNSLCHLFQCQIWLWSRKTCLLELKYNKYIFNSFSSRGTDNVLLFYIEEKRYYYSRNTQNFSTHTYSTRRGLWCQMLLRMGKCVKILQYLKSWSHCFNLCVKTGIWMKTLVSTSPKEKNIYGILVIKTSLES